MDLIDKIDTKLHEDFTKGKDAAYLAGYMVTMFKKKIQTLESASKVGNYGVTHEVVRSTLNDLNAIKKRLDQIARGK
jgi:hypothetical protein